MLSASMSLYLLCLLTVVLSECDTHQKFNVWLTSDMNKLLFHRHSASNASVVTLLEFSSVGILSSQADSKQNQNSISPQEVATLCKCTSWNIIMGSVSVVRNKISENIH